MKRALITSALALAVAFLPQICLADEQKQSDPTVKVEVPASHYTRKVAFFPLELPVYALKLALWPIGEGLGFLERKHVFARGAEFLSNDAKTFWVYPIIDWGAGTSFGGGAGFKYTDLFHQGYVLTGSYRIHIDLNQYINLSLFKHDAFYLWDKPVSLKSRLEIDDLRSMDYYGKGDDTPRSDRSRYSITSIDWDGRLIYEPMKNFEVDAKLGVLAATTGPSTYGGYPSVDTTFSAADLPGFDRWLTYLSLGVGVAHDTRDNTLKPQKGGRQEFSFYRYQCLNSDSFSFNQYVLDFTQYFPLWRPGVTLGVRNNWTFQQEFGEQRVPFYRLTLLDYRSPLRGFKRGRFHDLSSVLFNFDYTYPVSSLVEGLIFVDTGKVFDGVTNFNFDHWRYSVGGGFNLTLFKITLLRFRAAYGGEGVNLIFGMAVSI